MTTIEPMPTPPSGPDGLAALLRTVLDDWVERMCLFNCDANSSCPCAAHKAHTEALAALTAPPAPAPAVDPGWRDLPIFAVEDGETLVSRIQIIRDGDDYRATWLSADGNQAASGDVAQTEQEALAKLMTTLAWIAEDDAKNAPAPPEGDQ